MPTLQVIKSIETVYNGYRFRSRLEARWAVFFDAMGIKYEYEMEGFDLGDGVYYLPDFYLPDLDVFVEVKPTKEIAPEIEAKINKFCGKDKNLLLIMGTPGDEKMVRGSNGDSVWYYVRFSKLPFSDGWSIVYKGDKDVMYNKAIEEARQARFEFNDAKIKSKATSRG